MPSMQDQVRKHLRSKRAARKPHVQQDLPRQAARGKKTRPASKAQAGKGHSAGSGGSQPESQASREEVETGTAALFTIQRDSDGRWKWDAYDKFGLKVATQEKLTDALQALEEIIRWHAGDIASFEKS